MLRSAHLLGNSVRLIAAMLLTLGLVLVLVGTVQIVRALGRHRSVPDVPRSSPVSTGVLVWVVALIFWLIVLSWHLWR